MPQRKSVSAGTYALRHSMGRLGDAATELFDRAEAAADSFGGGTS